MKNHGENLYVFNLFTKHLCRKKDKNEKNEKIIQIKGSIENLFLVREDLGKI